jgi:hypothetical protein
MKRCATRLLVLWALATLTMAGAHAAEIVLEQSAVDKLVAQALFNNNGRYELVRGPCFSYLDKPSVTLQNGRLKIRSHLTSRVGVPSGNACMGMAFTSWTEVSGRPVPRGGSVVLADIRVDKVDEPTLRMVLESGLVPALPGVIELDVQKSVRDMLRNAGGANGGYDASVAAFNIESVTAADNRLAVKFDFTLVAK